MRKTLFIFFILTILFSFCGTAKDKEKKETLTITTYFPSPRGVYNEVSVEGGIIFKPQDGSDSADNKCISDLTCDSSKKGMLAYGLYDAFASENKFYYCNGSKWVEF